MKGAGRPKGVASQPHAEGKAWERFGYTDPHEVLGENATINPGESLANDARKARRRLLRVESHQKKRQLQAIIRRKIP